ncbi:MAG: hypothetical protein PHT99_08215, partial [Methanoregula sp.]|nr:hypothetical protein [Methanoregula sp.]
GYNGATVAFTLTGTNFQEGGTNVTFWIRAGNTVLVPLILNVKSTQFVGSVALPPEVNQSWYVNISTVDGGSVSKEKAFKVN